MRAAVYCRVSTEEQAAEGMSIMAQRKALAEYAHKNQMIVVDEFVDEGVSARTAERPQFQRMVSAAKKKPRPFDVILIHKTDRFARNREDAIVYKSLLRRDCGIEVRSVTEQFEDSPTGKLLEGMMEVMAEFYSLNLSQEVMKGMKEKASQGKGLGMAPLGYRLTESGKLEVVPEEAAVVRFIFETYTKEQQGLLTVAHRLHQDGFRLFGPAGSKYKWSSIGIRVILRNPVYTGTFVWNRRDGNKKNRFRKPEDWIIAENAHEPIIDQATFDLAGEILRGRRGVRNPIGDFVLRGMARCADCGSGMSHYRLQWKRNNGETIVVPQLSCSGYQRSRTCYFNHVKIADVEEAIFKYLSQVMEGEITPADVDVQFTTAEPAREEAEGIRRQLAATDAKFQRQLQAFEAGAIEVEELKAAKERVLAERTLLYEQLATVERKLDATAPTNVSTLRGRIRDILAAAMNESLPPADRRRALRSVVHHVEYSRRQDRLRIVLHL